MGEEKNYLLGMDCGTTNIKGILLSEDGTVVAEASRPSTFIMPGSNMQEQDANEWWSNTVGIFSEIAAQVGSKVISGVRGICISSHTVSMLPVDEQGNPLRNAMTYQDGRSGVEMQEILEKVGFKRFVDIVGSQPAVAFLPHKLLWFRRHEPDLFQKTHCFLQASSYINFKLTDQMTGDMDQASRTQCLDVTTMQWSKEIGDAVGMDFTKFLPPPIPVDQIIGTVTQKAAVETGLIEGIPVLAGCSDAMASLYATGMSVLGDAGESSGTSSLVFVGSKVKGAADCPVAARACAIEGMPWVFDAPIQTTGATLRWFIEKLAAEERATAELIGEDIYTYLNNLALQAPPGANGLIFYPYLMGERAPLWNNHARGMFIGMGMGMQRHDLVRALFEGTAFALRHVVETTKVAGGCIERLRICGGGAKSRTWAMIKASMLKVPVYIMDEKSGNVPVGDALIAGYCVGVFADLKQAAANAVKVKEIIYPIQEWSEAYDKLYPYYVEMYQHLDNDLLRLRMTLEEIT